MRLPRSSQLSLPRVTIGPFTRIHSRGEEAEARCAYGGHDLYYVLGSAQRILAYGMLRGWDEGFDVPSLGLAVAPDSRRRGFGILMLEFLHAAAGCRGAESVRLTLYAANEEARSLYARFGYRFAERAPGVLVGTRSLAR